MKRFYLAYSDPLIWRQAVAKSPSFSITNAKRRQKVAKMSDENIVVRMQQLVTAIPWSHNLIILNKLAEALPRIYYLKATAQYQLKPTLPREFKGKLPSPRELGQALGLGAKRRKAVRK